MKQILRSMGLLIFVAVSAQAAVLVPLPPFTVYGTVRNWNGRAFSRNDAATVVVKVKGVEVNRCVANSGSYQALNYRVQIPLASGKMVGRGEINDLITFEVYYDGQVCAVIAESSALTVVKPAGAVRCDMVVGTNSDGDGLPDEYKRLLMPYYEAAGLGSELADIKSTDDFDGDGFSNFQEFLAGTIPVLGSDYLKITRFVPAEDGFMALSFLSAPGRTYTLPKVSNMSSNAWDQADFATTADKQSMQTFLHTEADANVTLYLLPTTNSAFFRLGVQ